MYPGNQATQDKLNQIHESFMIILRLRREGRYYVLHLSISGNFVYPLSYKVAIPEFLEYRAFKIIFLKEVQCVVKYFARENTHTPTHTRSHTDIHTHIHTHTYRHTQNTGCVFLPFFSSKFIINYWPIKN